LPPPDAGPRGHAAEPPQLLVDTPEALAALALRLAGQTPLGLDTEFVRERSYRPRLELLQVAAPDGTLALVDYGTLGCRAGDPLAARLADAGVLKVFHAGDQDLELLRPLTGRVLGPVWDTQLAAGLFPYVGGVGYAAMVEQLLGVALAKGETLTDWSRRPLSVRQQRYALDDVRHLLPLYRLQRERLGALGRLAWVAEECERLCRRVEQDQADLESATDLHRQVRGWRGFAPPGLAVLRELAEWREQAARAADRPRGSVMKDDLLREIVRRVPTHPERLGALRGLGPATLARHGTDIVAAVRRGLATPPASWPVAAPAEGRLDGPGQELFNLLQSALKALAGESGVAAPLLATTADLQRLLHGHLNGVPVSAADCPLLGGWRQELAGGLVRDVLAGRPAGGD
jgi:ribonuclease D